MAAKYWEIRESYGNKSEDPEIKEAYECGYEEGYEAAMKEMEPEMGMRGGMMGSRGAYGSRYGDINERTGGSGSMGYRRRR